MPQHHRARLPVSAFRFNATRRMRHGAGLAHVSLQPHACKAIYRTILGNFHHRSSESEGNHPGEAAGPEGLVSVTTVRDYSAPRSVPSQSDGSQIVIEAFAIEVLLRLADK